MQIVIDIPEDVLKRTVFYREFRELSDYVTTIKALEKAVPLPKGHGRLIDAEILCKEIMRAWNLWEKKGEDCYLFADVLTPMIASQKTLIDAESEVE